MTDAAARLLETADIAVEPWVYRCIVRFGVEGDTATARLAAESAHTEVMRRLSDLLSSDVDEQRSTPLTILRDAVRFPTAVLQDAGVMPVERDDFLVERFPHDVYGLVPSRAGDVDESLGEASIAWGAAKAFEHKARHGNGGAENGGGGVYEDGGGK